MINELNKNKHSQSVLLSNSIQTKGNKDTIKGISSTQEDSEIQSLQPAILPEKAIPNIQSYISEHIITPEEENSIKETLSQHFVFKEMNQDIYKIILQDLVYFVFDKDYVIYEEGDEGNFFFILANGKIEATAKSKQTRYYNKWTCFGELSLIAKCKREESLKCLSRCSLFCLDSNAFRDVQKKLNESRLRERYDFLNTISLFKPLEAVSKYNVTDRLQLKDFNVNEKIIIFGDIGHTLYIIKSGVVSCQIGNQEFRRLTNNNFFGQNAILIDAKRGCDVVAIQPTRCYELSRNDLIEALGVDYVSIILFSFFVYSINCNEYLKDILIESKQNELFKLFKIRIYKTNEYISTKQEKTNKRIIIIIEGSLYKDAEHIYAEKGNIIGEEIFKDPKQDLPKNAYANPDCISLEADFEDLAQFLQINYKLEKPMNLISRVSKLKKLTLFQNISENSIESLALRMTKQKFKADDIIVEENTFGDKFYLITKGRVRITVKDKVVRDLENGSCFGEIALLTSDKRTATVSAIEDVSCFVLSKADFDLIIESNNIKEYLIKKLALQDTSIELKDLNFIKYLGKGKFGCVNLVHNRKNIYAIKAVSRRSVERAKMLAKYFVNERRVMLSLDHPFIVKMVKTLKNTAFCFFLMEFVNGKNLDEYLADRQSKRNIPETQFYFGSMLLMVEYLQKKFIAHRDIKPSNIMIDANGYLKMIDFGTAKILTDYTQTLIGTPHYIPPEILCGKGYSLSCDFWSLGICMFEIFYGIYPFGQYANEANEIYRDILHKDFNFPTDNPKYNITNQFIKNLLMKKVNQRVCNVVHLKSKDFFKDFPWDDLIDFKLKPPYIPQTSKYDHTLNDHNSFSDLMKEDMVPAIKDRDECKDYDRRWADEF